MKRMTTEELLREVDRQVHPSYGSMEPTKTLAGRKVSWTFRWLFAPAHLLDAMYLELHRLRRENARMKKQIDRQANVCRSGREVFERCNVPKAPTCPRCGGRGTIIDRYDQVTINCPRCTGQTHAND